MSNNILFVFEGANTEKQIADSFLRYFSRKSIVVQCAYCTTIYNLYNKIIKDEDLDTFSLLKEIPNNRETLAPYIRSDFAEIYLFFDYDGHSSSASDDKMKNILDLFNEETEFGKIFINYPMVESLKHYSQSIDFKLLKVPAKKNIKYKNIVSVEGNEEYRHFHLYTQEIWSILIEVHLKKMNYISNGEYVLPSEYCSQNDIFDNQLEKYINVDTTIAVLSSFPIFLFDYYGSGKILEIISN